MATNYRQRRPDIGPRITPAAVAAFRAAAWIELHRLLGLRPWMPSPLDAAGKCPWPPNSAGARYWPQAVALRDELEAA